MRKLSLGSVDIKAVGVDHARGLAHTHCAMLTRDTLDTFLRNVHDIRFKEFEDEVVRRHTLYERAKKFEQTRDKRRREFLKGIGVDLTAFDREQDKELKGQEQELKAYLAEVTPKVASRPVQQAGDLKEAALRDPARAGTSHTVLRPYASTLFAADKGVLKDVSGVAGDGAINSGWVFPDEAGKIRVKDTARCPVACFFACAGGSTGFAVHFTFTPATTANYEMTAIFAFHGFYILRSDDSWYNCRNAKVKLTISMNAHQYADIGKKDFPALIDRDEDNVEEVTSYDRTHFFDYTTVLKAGDPVIVTVGGTLDARAHGGGAYAELNFEAGTANYIEPLLLSVLQV
jgi:hypothetical protein